MCIQYADLPTHPHLEGVTLIFSLSPAHPHNIWNLPHFFTSFDVCFCFTSRSANSLTKVNTVIGQREVRDMSSLHLTAYLVSDPSWGQIKVVQRWKLSKVQLQARHCIVSQLVPRQADLGEAVLWLEGLEEGGGVLWLQGIVGEVKLWWVSIFLKKLQFVDWTQNVIQEFSTLEWQSIWVKPCCVEVHWYTSMHNITCDTFWSVSLNEMTFKLC